MRIAQEEGGVVGGHELGAVEGVKAPPEGGYFFFGLQESLGREGPQAADDPGLDGLQLFEEKGETRADLIGSGIAVVWGAAFHDVGDVYLLPGQVYGLDDASEEFPGPADKGLALQIFIPARALSYEDETCVGIARAEDQVVSPLMELAPGTRSQLLPDTVEGQRRMCLTLGEEGMDS